MAWTFRVYLAILSAFYSTGDTLLTPPFSFSPPHSSSMPLHSAICQEDTENGNHDNGIPIGSLVVPFGDFLTGF